MGLVDNGCDSASHTHKVFLLANYALIGAASSCIFLTLSLRLNPSLAGAFLVLLHAVTIAGAGCNVASRGGGSRFYGAHMVATALTAIFQGSVSVLIFSRPRISLDTSSRTSGRTTPSSSRNSPAGCAR
ncbi:Unknown protein [Striga hermonthica]|uniref:Uncharacterized protein n=1 Tax=Striga hermonthica TaxID=68872 RepID=A0A9N7RPY9_STRHE|nr:Unknown protein [Striga hermonthica]